MTKTHHKWTFFATIMLLSAIVLPSVAFAEQSGADSAIESAKQQIVTRYNAAKAAEAAGANITSLTSLLNDAGNLLSQAELAYSKNDFSNAQNLATQSSQSLSNFVSEANTMQDAAAQQRNTDFLVNIVGSIAGTIAVIVAGFVVWYLVKRRQPNIGEQTDKPE